jgi:REP element-mobilizing transposase RayT
LGANVPPVRPVKEPRAYFLTVVCYGARLHGEDRGAVDREHNAYRGPLLPPDERRERLVRRLMSEEAVRLGAAEREATLSEIQRTCVYREWTLHAAHIRTTHLHVIVTAPTPPEKVMGELKAYASRALNDQFGHRMRRWARHASTVWLWDDARVRKAMDYVVLSQGKPMTLYVNPLLWPEYA